MQLQAVTVGPLASSAANNIVTSTKDAFANPLPLIGTLTDAATTAVCASQAVGAAGNLTINGTLASGGVASFTRMRNVIVNSAGNDSGITFTITGLGIAQTGASQMLGGAIIGSMPGMLNSPVYGITETVTGANASNIVTKNLFWQVTQVAASGAAAGNVTVGMNGLATLDVARQVLITSGGNDSGINFAIVGTDWAGLPISESLVGGNAVAVGSVLSYKTVSSITPSAAVATTVTVGTSGVAYSPWVSFDPYAGNAATSIQVNGTGSVTWTVQQTLDSPNDPNFPVTPANMKWVAHPDTNLVAATTITGVQGNYAYIPVWARVLLNSGSGSVTAKFIQSFLRS